MTEEEFQEREAEKEQQKIENKHNAHNNAKALRVAATVAQKSGEPHAVVIGTLVNGADKLTGGKSTELLGHAVNQGLKHQPGGKQAQKALNKLGDSGITDAAGKVAASSGSTTPQNPAQNNGTPAATNSSQQNKPTKNANDNKQKKTNDNKNNNGNTVNVSLNNEKTGKNSDEESKEEKKGCSFAAIIGGIIFITILPTLLTIFFTILVPLVILFFLGDGSTGTDSITLNSYHTPRCNEMTVIFVDKNNGYAVTGSQTYSMEDYIAGVVYAEVGGAQNMEVYKTFAVAARTFGLKHASEDCTIEGSARRQAFKDITNKPNEAANMIYEAVKATDGEVVMSKGELYSIQYDAFCFNSKESGYYTLVQKNQKVPIDWVETNIGRNIYTQCPCNLNDKSMTNCWSNGVWQDGGHGRGMSQYGSYYLAKEKGYTYEEILNYYYGEDNISIKSNSFMSSIAGLEIKDTTKATPLKEPISTFLSSKGSSVDNLNNFIHESVKENGPGTREGVVTAAVSMINYLYDNFNVKLPYYWGGRVSGDSIPSSFGTYSPSTISRGGNVNYYKSFDCSGFASWAIRTGGYNFENKTTATIDSAFSKNSCNITESTCIGQPGDLINSRSGHVELIIAVDEENQKYFIAHSGGPGVVMQERGMHKGNSSNNVTKIIFMDDFYNNPSNVNLNY